MDNRALATGRVVALDLGLLLTQPGPSCSAVEITSTSASAEILEPRRLLIIANGCPFWVKSGKARPEQMLSASHPIATQQRT